MGRHDSRIHYICISYELPGTRLEKAQGVNIFAPQPTWVQMSLSIPSFLLSITREPYVLLLFFSFFSFLLLLLLLLHFFFTWGLLLFCITFWHNYVVILCWLLSKHNLTDYYLDNYKISLIPVMWKDLKKKKKQKWAQIPGITLRHPTLLRQRCRGKSEALRVYMYVCVGLSI